MGLADEDSAGAREGRRETADRGVALFHGAGGSVQIWTEGCEGVWLHVTIIGCFVWRGKGRKIGLEISAGGYLGR